MMTAVPLDAAVVEAAQVGPVLLEAPTLRILMEIAAGVGAEGRDEVWTRLDHAPG